MREPERQPEVRHFISFLQILNAIRKHAGLEAATPFTAEKLASIDGFSFGAYAPADLSDAEEAAVDRLRQFFAKPLDDLEALLQEFELDQYMSGLEQEDI